MRCPCRGSLHELQVEFWALFTGHPCRGSLHELQLKLRAPLTDRQKQILAQHAVESYGVFYGEFYTGSGPPPPRGEMRHMILP